MTRARAATAGLVISMARPAGYHQPVMSLWFRRPVTALRSVALSTALLGVLTACGAGTAEDPDAGATVTPTASTTAAGDCRYPSAAPSPARPAPTPSPDLPDYQIAQVQLRTDFGIIPITLSTATAPCAVHAFLTLARSGFYDDTTCHRLTTEGYYILQCGDPSGTGYGGPGFRFDDELVPQDPRLTPCRQQGGATWCRFPAGTVAYANPGPDSNGSQFFMVYRDSFFPPQYTVLGQVDDAGLKVLRSIASLGVGQPNGMAGRNDGAPAEPVQIIRVD